LPISHRSKAIPLGNEALSALADRVDVPTYDRSVLSPGVVHLGVGGFHRAHQLVYFDDLAERRISTEWGVVGVGMRSSSMRDALSPQDYLFTVVQKGPRGETGRVVGVLGSYLFAPENPDAVLEVLSAASTRLVTLTVTANGYPVDPATGEFDARAVDIAADLRAPHRPVSAFGFLVEALDRRRRSGGTGFTVLSCDNLQHNGAAARTALLGFAVRRNPALAAWISEQVSFPSSMVDRITPETSPQERDAIADRLGVDDRWPVITEPFSQWIIEDDFVRGRPPLDQVGVQFVDDVQPYKIIKTRLLNAGHSAVGYLGYLCGYRTMHEAMADPLVTEYVVRLMDEVSPMLPIAAGMDVRLYRRRLLERFANPGISDRLSRLCGRGSTKMPGYLLPSLRQALLEGRDCEMLTLAVAGWFHYLRGFDESGREIEIQDAQKDSLQALARRGGTDPGVLLRGSSLFDRLDGFQEYPALEDYPAFVDALAELLSAIDRDGMRAVLAAAVQESPEMMTA
jgi:fructuronate reductase/mannitol 2-dehydrogenase